MSDDPRDRLIRRYTDIRQVRVGDVVAMRNDHISPFSTSIVTGIEDLDGDYPQVHLARPHARCESHRITGHLRGEQVAVMVETYSVEASRFCDCYEVFVSGDRGQVDNRNGIYTREMVDKTDKAGETIEDRDEPCPLA